MPTLTPVQGNPFGQAQQPKLTPVQGNPFEAASQDGQQGAADPQPGFLDRAREAVTGASRMTEEMSNLPEIGDAPELNERSMAAFKTSLGLLTAGDEESQRGILQSQLGQKDLRDLISGKDGGVSFRQDEKGNTIVDLPSGSYALNKPGFSPQDAARAIFTMLSFTPAGRSTTIPGAVGTSAATELALEGTSQSLGGEDIKPANVAISGLTGGVFKGGEKAIGAAYRGIKGNAANGLVEAGNDAGVRVLTSDVFQPSNFVSKTAQQTGEKIPFAGTGGVRETQQIAREKAVSDVADKYGEFSYSAIVDSLKTQKNRVKNAAGSVLEATGRKMDQAGEIPMDNTRRALGEAFSELNRKGVIQSSSALQDLEHLVETISQAPQTFSTLKENRTAFREIIQGADKAERSQLTSRAKSLLERVNSAMKQDMDAFAKSNLTPQEFGKWQKANSVYAEEAQKLTKSRLKNVLDKGDVTPESVQTMLFSQKPSEVSALYKSLTPAGRANARAAIISKVFNDLNRRASGVTPNSFANEMKKYGPQIGGFFRGEERKQLRGLLKVLDATKRAQDAAVTTPTGQQLLGAGTIAAAATDLGATIGLGGTLGLFARAYESRPVRNALLRLDSLPAGSTEFEKASAEVVRLLTAGSQTARREAADTESRQKGTRE